VKRDKDLELEGMNQDDGAWAKLLSGAADLRDLDENATSQVFKALNLERQQNSEITSPVWDNYLSSAAVLRPVDYGSIKPTLATMKLERLRSHKILRLNIMKLVTASAAVAAVVVGTLIFSHPSEADPTDAFTAYQEASQGW
jgi:hypothetical protein